jgi:hypothetical protein
MVSSRTLKKVQTMKTKLEIRSATPVVLAESEDLIKPFEQIPVWARPFIGKTPAQFLQKFIPRVKLEALAGAMFAFCDLGVTIPKWAQNASMQFWKNYIGNKPLRPTESAEDFGVLLVILEKFIKGHLIQPQTVAPTSKLEIFLSKIAKKVYSLLMREVESKLSHEEKSQFYAGCARGEQILARMQNSNFLDMMPLAPVYLVVAVAWKEIESLDTHAKRIQWLKDNKVIKMITTGDEAGKYVPSDRSVYQAFDIIGLLGAKPGKSEKAEV